MTLNYEMEVLESFIKESLDPKKLLNEDAVSQHQFEKWNQLLTEEKDAIRKRIKKATYSYTKEAHRKLYIEQHEFAIIHLKNVLIGFLLPKNAEALVEAPGDTVVVKLYKRSLGVLRELLSFIKEEFPQYFNYDERVPASTLLNLQEVLKLRITKLKKQLLKAGHDAELIELAIQTIHINYYNETCQLLTYKKWSYFKALLVALEEMKPDELPLSHFSSLIVLLVHMNFNATVFKNYFVKLIHAEINSVSSLHGKIEIISFHHKEISQLQVKPEMALSPALPSVQLDLVTWLFNEMSHLEKKQTLGLVAPVEFKDPGDPEAEKGIYSVLTVEELGLLLRIQKDTNLLKNKNMKQVARSVAENWHTKQKENISWQYLYNSMSTVEMGTIKSLEDKLVGLVNRLRKMKGGMK